MNQLRKTVVILIIKDDKAIKFDSIISDYNLEGAKNLKNLNMICIC